MAQTADRILIRKNIRLCKDTHLIFDKERDYYRISVWRPRKPGETDVLVDKLVHDALTRAGMIPKKPRDYWIRIAGTAPRLKDGITMALHDAKVSYDPDELFHYIRTTEWASELQ